jgi:hypothetical protein
MMCVRDIPSRWIVFSFLGSFQCGQLEYNGPDSSLMLKSWLASHLRDFAPGLRKYI